MAKSKQVIFADGIYWYSVKLVAEKTGLTKPEIIRRAIAGKFRFQVDSFNNPAWIAEPDIDPLRKEFMRKELERKKKPKRPRTIKQIESDNRYRPPSRKVHVDYHSKPLRGGLNIGPLVLHAERVMLSDLNREVVKGDTEGGDKD